MANTIKKGESLFIPFRNGESVYDSQLKPRMYKTKEQYERFSYHFKDAEMVEYAEVVRCKECKHWGVQENCDPSFKYYCNADALYAWGRPVRNADDFCSYGERKDNESQER